MSKIKTDEFTEKIAGHLLETPHQRAKLRVNNRRFETNRKKKARYHMAKNGIGKYWLPKYKRVGRYTGETRTTYHDVPIYEDDERELSYYDQKGEPKTVKYTYKKKVGYIRYTYIHHIKRTEWKDREPATRANRYYQSGSLKEAKKRMNRKIRRNKLGTFKGSSFKKCDDIWCYID